MHEISINGKINVGRARFAEAKSRVPGDMRGTNAAIRRRDTCAVIDNRYYLICGRSRPREIIGSIRACYFVLALLFGSLAIARNSDFRRSQKTEVVRIKRKHPGRFHFSQLEDSNPPIWSIDRIFDVGCCKRRRCLIKC